MTFASADAEVRSLKLYYVHTKETATIAFKKNGKYIPSGLRKLNRFLRDWRRNEPTRMDPKLFDLVWEVYQRTGSKKTIQVISGYRSPKTNAALRRRGRGVATKSQHIRGKALDFFLPDVSIEQLRALGLKAEVGGVGYYRGAFIHLDTGRVRHWPRMSRRQLARIFPRGRTLQIPSDGKPMAGYKYALAKYKKRKRSGGSVLLASAGRSTTRNKSGGFLKRIFGGGSDEAEDNTAVRVAAKKSTRKETRLALAKTTTRKSSAKSKRAQSAKRGNSNLPGVNISSDARARLRPLDKPAEKEPSRIPVLPSRVAIPIFRPAPAAPGVADTAIASNDVSNSKADSIIASRFEPAEPTLPSLRPSLNVGESRFALAAIPQPSATQRAAEALARTLPKPAHRPVLLSSDRFATTPLDERISVALLTSEKSANGGQNRISPSPQVLGVVGTPSISAPIPTANPAEGKLALAKPAAAAKPKQTSRIDSAFSALSPAKKASIATPDARPANGFSTARIAVPTQKFERQTAANSANTGRRIKFQVAKLQLGNLNSDYVTSWALSHSTRVGKFAKLTAPRYLGVLRNAPIAVSNAGFSDGENAGRINKFSGQAIKRIAFAKFVTADLPRNEVFLTDRY